MRLFFAHGWGFDRHFWSPLTELLSDLPQDIDDRGYFGAPLQASPQGPCIAVTHSFGTMRVLAAPPSELCGIVAINGFARFTPANGNSGVQVRVLDRMLRRFGSDPRGVLSEFRKTCGTSEAFEDIDLKVLEGDLLSLRNDAPPLPDVSIVSIQGDKDPLLPPQMRETVFSGIPIHRITHKSAGHLLPREAPDLCAAAVRGLIEAIGT